MNFNEAIEYIYSLGMFSFEPSLSRMQKAVEVLDCKNTFPVIHIAGTNGKGSVAAMCSAALKKEGYKTALFVSPHIIDFCERIQINGEFIPGDDLTRITERIKSQNLTLSEFEFITLIALIWFSEQKVDVAVLETGLGGRLDATNIAENKIITVITKIGLDHTKILGNTAELIAREKCGIIKGTKTVSNPNQPSGITEIIKGYSKQLTVPDNSKLEILKCDAFGNEFIYKGERYVTGMSGSYQIENAVTAIETLENCGLEISRENIKEGVFRGFMPGRMQMVSKKPIIIVDGAHNPDGASVLARMLEKASPVTAIIGVMRDKDYEGLLKITMPFAERAICVKACDYGRALPANELAAAAGKYCKNVIEEPSLKSALKRAKQFDDPIFVFGSLYLASDFLKLF